jgi:hypothetical protein
MRVLKCIRLDVFVEIRPSVKSMCLLWCLCVVQIIKSTVVISIEYRSLSADYV